MQADSRDASALKVRDYEFDPEDGRITALLFDALGVPLLPVRVLRPDHSPQKCAASIPGG
jgi:hypothetical protein